MSFFNFIKSLFGTANPTPSGTETTNVNTISQDNMDHLIDASWSGYATK